MGEDEKEVEKNSEENKKSTQARKEKKGASSPWNFLFFIRPPPFPFACKVSKVESK